MKMYLNGNQIHCSKTKLDF